MSGTMSASWRRLLQRVGADEACEVRDAAVEGDGDVRPGGAGREIGGCVETLHLDGRAGWRGRGGAAGLQRGDGRFRESSRRTRIGQSLGGTLAARDRNREGGSEYDDDG